MTVSTRQRRLWLSAAAASALLVVLLLNLPSASAPTADGQPAALRVQIDPETGDLVPVSGSNKAALEYQLQLQLNRSDIGLQEKRHSDGGVSVDLQGRFQSLSVATTDSDGVLHTKCVTNQAELDHFMKTKGEQADGVKE